MFKSFMSRAAGWFRGRGEQSRPSRIYAAGFKRYTRFGWSKCDQKDPGAVAWYRWDWRSGRTLRRSGFREKLRHRRREWRRSVKLLAKLARRSYSEAKNDPYVLNILGPYPDVPLTK